MNFSISSLLTSHLNFSPFIFKSPSYKSTYFKISNSKIQNSFSSFFQSNNFLNNQKNIFHNNYFHNFLNTVIKINKIELTNQVITDQFRSSDTEILIEKCIFEHLRSNTDGSAINIYSPDGQFTTKNSFFDECETTQKGGAIFVSCKEIYFIKDCFHLCRCGKEDGCDGSTIYADASDLIYSEFLSCHKCPKHGEMCWYGICNMWHGDLISKNINISKSDVEYVCGLAHCSPDRKNSTILFYTSVNGLTGNSLTFVSCRFNGNHRFGNIYNNSCKQSSGLIYFQDSETTLHDFIFLQNKGPLTYSCVGVSYGHFVNCSFDQIINTGIGFKSTKDCLVKVVGLKLLQFAEFYTAACVQDPDPNDAPKDYSFIYNLLIILLVICLLFAIIYNILQMSCGIHRKKKKSHKRKGTVLPSYLT